jgi:hypothetical protein
LVFGFLFQSPTSALYFDVTIFALLAIEFTFIYAFPSVRRLGISPAGLVVDVGLRKLSYPWPSLESITRTHVSRFRWNQVSSVSRTRITLGSGLSRNTFTLSAYQGERLASFLRIP